MPVNASVHTCNRVVHGCTSEACQAFAAKWATARIIRDLGANNPDAGLPTP